MRVLLLWVVVGLSAIAFAHGATTRKVQSTSTTTASLTSNKNTTQALPVSTSTTVDTVQKSQTTKSAVSTNHPGVRRASPKILRVQRSTTHQGKIAETLATAAASNPTTAKPSRKHRTRHGRRRNRLSHRVKAAGKSPLLPSTYNLTSSATQDAATKTAEAVEQPAIKPQETENDQEANQNYAAQDEYYKTEKPPGYYTYSLSSTYSAKLGGGPEFASSENYAARPLEDYEGAESNSNVKRDDQHANQAETKSEPKKNCKYMQKPMPAYIHYGDQVEKTGANDQGPMMTCYVCGSKDEPYAYGGFTEECSYTPSKSKNPFADYDRGQSQFADQPYLSSGTTTDKLYAGKGQTPYLTVAAGGSHGSSHKERRPSYDPYYDEGYYGGHENEPQATSHSGGSRSGNGGDYDGGAATDKETCKISYRGKMKCKICGDSKSDAIFSEQCDYEKDDPNQQRTRAYDYGSGSEKSYKSPRGSKGNHGDGDGDSGYGGGQGGYGDDGYGQGYGGDNYGYNYPDYGGYGSGTGYGPSYDSYPYFDSHYGGGPDGSYDDDSKHGSGDTGGSSYDTDKNVGSGGSHYGDDKQGGSRGSHYGDDKQGGSGGHAGGSHGGSAGDDGKYSGTRQSLDYIPEQPEASNTHVSDKKGSSTEPDKKICKVVYKDYTPYSPYSNSNSKSKDESKPKMKCMVCTRSDGFGGVSEECSYSGVGETTTRGNFPGSKDISSFFGSPDLDRFYAPNFDEYHDSFF